MAHSCSTLVIHCIDFRFGKALKSYLEEKGYLGDCDIVSIAGAAKNIASPSKETDAELVLRQIDIAKRLHDIRQVVIINHTDCGAYGGRQAFSSQEEERVLHEAELAAAKEKIVAQFPTLIVARVIAHIDEEGAITFHEIETQ